MIEPATPRKAEIIAVQIRWLGLILGYTYVHLAALDVRQPTLDIILAIGAVYTVLDTLYAWRGRGFLVDQPLIISLMESIFIGLLCYCDRGLDSPFRYYYFLSLICCALRQSGWVTSLTCTFHCVSYAFLYAALPATERDLFGLFLTLVVIVWVAWASSALASHLRRGADELSRLNLALRENQAQLEARIADRTRELQEAQAHLLHQEKMAAFGLLAAGIAHEVGNPLTSVSSLVQMLQKRDSDDYTRERLGLVSGELQRIHHILRELVNFSRPASSQLGPVRMDEVIHEALNIAKYYKGTKSRQIIAHIPEQIPGVRGVRDQLVQAVLNLVLNAIDATNKGGRIELTVTRENSDVVLRVSDDGHGVANEHIDRLFQPYFTTKKHGTGLGLFVTRRLIQDHGGQIRFVPSPVCGACVEVRLPAEDRSVLSFSTRE